MCRLAHIYLVIGWGIIFFLCGSRVLQSSSSDPRVQDVRTCGLTSHKNLPWLKKHLQEGSTTPSEVITIQEGTHSPSSPVRTPGEFEPCQGVIIYWDLGYAQALNPIFQTMIRNMNAGKTIYIGVENDTDRMRVRSMVAGTGYPLDDVVFLTYPCSPYWMRDFGPFFAYDSSGDLIAIHTEYRSYLPQADSFPHYFSREFGYECYHTGFVLDGGHFTTDGKGLVAVTDHFYCLNPGLSSDRADSLMAAYFGCDRFLVFETCEESGHLIHIDVWAKFLDATTVLVSQFEDTTAVEYSLLENFASVFDTIKTWIGTPFDVVRVPMHYDYTYINSLILDNQVFLPVYQQPEDTMATAAYHSVLPEYEIVPIDCYNIFNQYGGAIHCLTREVPEAITTSGVKVTTESGAGGPAGEDVPVTFMILNAGNVPDKYDIEISDAQSWIVNPRSFQVTLEAGLDTALSVRVTIPDSVAEGTMNEVTLTATSQIVPSVSGTNSVMVTVCETNKGDVNTDCTIDILDVVSIVNTILDVKELSPDEMWWADCNGPMGICDGDGEIDVLDAIKIINLILGVDACP